jgi:hypothetical protein
MSDENNEDYENSDDSILDKYLPPKIPNNVSLIGLMGLKQSGKDTCADYLVENYSYTKRAFADCLKAACAELFLLNHEQKYGNLKETPDPRWSNVTPRRIFEFVGTDLLREQLEKIIPGIGQDVFVRNFELWFLNKINNNKNDKIKITVSDVRFQNEVDLIHKLNGIVIYIHRQSVMPKDTKSMHRSEKELLNIIDYDYVIFNDGTLDQLYNEIERKIKNLNLN